MAGTIYLEGKSAVFDGSPVGHLYLVYENADGDEFVIRGGPRNDSLSQPIEVEVGITLATSEDARASTLQAKQARGQLALDLGGRSADDVWAIMLQHAADIQDENLPYDVIPLQNSNSTVASVLNVVGLQLTTVPNVAGVFGYPGSGNLLAFDYSLVDTANNDILRGFTGNDQFGLSTGNDTVSGGAGTDTVIIRSSSRADAQVTASGATKTIVTQAAGTKSLTDVENVVYTAHSKVTSNALLPFGANTLYRNDDGSSSLINLGSIFEQGLNFNGNTFNGLYVNTNGNITFDGPLSQYTPGTIGNGALSIIAPFWADVDTRLPDTGTSGNVYWDFNAARDSFVVTWSDVGYYNRKVDKTNTFQMELVDQGAGNFEIIFRYADISWTTGDASSGTGGLGGTVARGGFSSGNGLYFELPGSGNQDSVLNWETRQGNTGTAGVWQFQVSSGNFENFGTAEANTYNGTSTDDYYFAGGGADRLFGNAGNDSLYGEAGDDYLYGGSGNDWCEGGQGLDWFIGGSGAGDDRYDGGSEADTVTFHSTTSGVRVSLTAGTATGRQIGSDTLISIENVEGGRGSDTLTGNNGANILKGLAGNDVISGLGGADKIYGGTGRDVMSGGLGADDFVFTSIGDSKKGALRDRILDFKVRVDDIDLSLIDANGSASGSTAFKFLASEGAAFTGIRGQLRWDKTAGSTLIEGDINGDGRADFQIEISRAVTLKAGDFIL